MNMFMIAAIAGGALLAGADPYLTGCATAFALAQTIWAGATAWMTRRLEAPVLSAAILGTLPVLVFAPLDLRAILVSLPGAFLGAVAARGLRA